MITKENELEIINQYTVEYKSINFLSKKYRVGKCKIYNILKNNVRSRSESAKISKKLNPRLGFKHTDEAKTKMREFRIKWMKNNPEKTAWRLSNISYPEKIFLEKLLDMEMNNRYLIIREMSFHPYFIDFAFINEKVAVEIDGSQHILPDRKLQDDKKDKILIENDWRVFRVTATEVILNIDSVMDNLINFINSDVIYETTGIHYKKMSNNTKWESRPQKYCKCGSNILEKSNCCLSCYRIDNRKVDRPDNQTILLDIKELGYRGTGRKYGVSDNAIRKWIKKVK